jgi:hypothetical protein
VIYGIIVVMVVWVFLSKKSIQWRFTTNNVVLLKKKQGKINEILILVPSFKSSSPASCNLIMY